MKPIKPQESSSSDWVNYKYLLLYLVLGLAAVLLPIVLWKLQLPNISSTYGSPYQVFELFGFCASAALIIAAWLELKKRRGAPFERLLPVILLVLIGFYSLILITETSAKSWDYEFYENAAEAVNQGENPYTGRYLYPPFTAQAMALVYRGVECTASGFQSNLNPEDIWYLVFYLYQCSQFFLILLAFILCYVFAREVGLKMAPASILVAALFLINSPLFRTLKFNQVNLYMLVLFLWAILLLKRYPIVSGLAIALGGHIKLYPLILLFPWAVTKKIAALAGSVVGFLGILLIQTSGGQDWRLWNQFLAFAGAPHEKVEFLVITYFRDNSLHSFIYNIFGTIAFIAGAEEPRFDLAAIVVVIATLAVIVWFIFRFKTREKACRVLANHTGRKVIAPGEDVYRLLGHSMDALALILIISPMVWEHQYILAIPIVIWTFAIRGFEKGWPIGIAAFLMFGIPTFDIFPLSYHRIAGLLMLLHYNSPEKFPTCNGSIKCRTVVENH